MGKMSELEMMVKELRGCGEKLIRMAEEMTEMFSASVHPLYLHHVLLLPH